MKILKLIAKIAAILAIAAAVAEIIIRLISLRDQQMDELDAYLAGGNDEDDEADVPTAASADDDYIEQDLDEWNSLEQGQHVELSMLIEPDQVPDVQKELASRGYSCSYDPDSKILDIEISGPKTREEIKELEALLQNILVSTDSTYLGFAFQ